MSGVVAALRPDDWNLPLFLHVLGAMLMLGGLVLAAICLFDAWRDSRAGSLQLAFRALLWVTLPAWLVMRVAAQWIYSKEEDAFGGTDPDWIGIGFATSESGLLLLIAATVLAGRSVGKAVELQADASAAASDTKVRVATVLVSLLIVIYLISIWAMTAKPGA